MGLLDQEDQYDLRSGVNNGRSRSPIHENALDSTKLFERETGGFIVLSNLQQVGLIPATNPSSDASYTWKETIKECCKVVASWSSKPYSLVFSFKKVIHVYSIW